MHRCQKLWTERFLGWVVNSFRETGIAWCEQARVEGLWHAPLSLGSLWSCIWLSGCIFCFSGILTYMYPFTWVRCDLVILQQFKRVEAGGFCAILCSDGMVVNYSSWTLFEHEKLQVFFSYPDPWILGGNTLISLFGLWYWRPLQQCHLCSIHWKSRKVLPWSTC